MRPEEKGISNALAIGIVIAILAVGIVAYVLLVPSGTLGNGTSTTASSSSSITSVSSFSTTSSTSSPSAKTGTLVMSFLTNQPLASFDVLANYSMNVITLGGIQSALQLRSATPQGISIIFSPNQFEASGGPTQVSVSFKVASSVLAGTYTFNITATGPGQIFYQQFHVIVVKYLVVTYSDYFRPLSLTIPRGTTVYWIRLNGAIDQYDDGTHDLVFENGMASSPALKQYQLYSYTFGAAGNFPYHCTFHPYMKGDITVT